MDDVRAVLDAVGSQRTLLWGAGPDGGGLCAMYAATYPERVQGLAFWNASAKVSRSPDYPWGSTHEEDAAFDRLVEQGWGDETYVPEIFRRAGAPTLAEDPVAVRWGARVCRRMGAPGDVMAFGEMVSSIDFRGILSSIHVPTAAIFRALPPATGSAPDDVGGYRDLAARIPGAIAIELPPADFPPWAQDTDAAVNALRGFVQQLHEEDAEFDRVLATVLFTDIVDSTVIAATMGDAKWRDLIADHDRLSRALVNRYRGTYVKSTGDGMLATFDGPARAVRCAHALAEAVTPLGIEIRSGAHAGEITAAEGDIAGLGVHVAARVAARAGASEIVVSSTVKDLTAGSGLVFADAGEHQLKGVPDRWHLYRVVTDSR
jgi:class 3 adenylate cyclase